MQVGQGDSRRDIPAVVDPRSASRHRSSSGPVKDLSGGRLGQSYRCSFGKPTLMMAADSATPARKDIEARITPPTSLIGSAIARDRSPFSGTIRRSDGGEAKGSLQ